MRSTTPESSEPPIPAMHAQDQIRLPTLLGHFAYSRFLRLPLADRLSALPLVAAAADFYGSPTAWRRCACMPMCITQNHLFGVPGSPVS